MSSGESERLWPVVARVRAEVEALFAAQPAPVASIKHEFILKSSPETGSVYGWRTTIQPLVTGEPMELWFDGHDDDLVLEVGTFGWFELFDLDHEDAVVGWVLDVVEAVVAGRALEYRTLLGRGCEVRTRDGRLLRVGNGRHVLRDSTSGRVLGRRQVTAFSASG